MSSPPSILGFYAGVRHEVAYVIVSSVDFDRKETCCSVNSSLPAHALLATAMCEAAGTMQPSLRTIPEPRGDGLLCERQCGGGARLDGMTNVCELLISIVNIRQAEDADRLGPKWRVAGCSRSG